MSESFHINLEWTRTNEFTSDKFSRDHIINFSGNQSLNSSSAPSFGGNEKLANPEELLASAVSSCHMLTFLVIAAKSGYVVDSYKDNAESILDKNEEGKLAITIINLKPIIVFSGEKIPNSEQLKSLHEKAHRNCFIANSVKTKVNIL